MCEIGIIQQCLEANYLLWESLILFLIVKTNWQLDGEIPELHELLVWTPFISLSITAVPILHPRNGAQPVIRPKTHRESSLRLRKSSGDYHACFSNLKSSFMSLLCLIFQIYFIMKKLFKGTILLKLKWPTMLLSLIYKFPIMSANMQTDFTFWIKLRKISPTENIHFKI